MTGAEIKYGLYYRFVWPVLPCTEIQRRTIDKTRVCTVVPISSLGRLCRMCDRATGSPVQRVLTPAMWAANVNDRSIKGDSEVANRVTLMDNTVSNANGDRRHDACGRICCVPITKSITGIQLHRMLLEPLVCTIGRVILLNVVIFKMDTGIIMPNLILKRKSLCHFVEK